MGRMLPGGRLIMDEGPTACPDPVLHSHVSPGYTPRDHMNRATHLVTCPTCGTRAGFRTREPFGWVKATTLARKMGWTRIGDPYGGPPAFACSVPCADAAAGLKPAMARLEHQAAATIRAMKG